MNFAAFIARILEMLGPGGALLLSLVVFLFGLGLYKFVKDWLPW